MKSQQLYLRTPGETTVRFALAQDRLYRIAAEPAHWPPWHNMGGPNMAFWLVKTEPSECSIDDFARAPDKPIRWDGVRNFQARNFLQQMAKGDQVFIYHSSCQHIGIAGIARVSASAYPDPSQFDPDSPYHDPRSTPEKPRWQAVDLVFQQRFATILPLAGIKALEGLDGLALLQRGSRLSVMPVTAQQWQVILQACQA